MFLKNKKNWDVRINDKLMDYCRITNGLLNTPKLCKEKKNLSMNIILDT